MVGSNKAAAPARGYWLGLEAGKLMFQRRNDCGSAVFHPRVLCLVCGGTSLDRE